MRKLVSLALVLAMVCTMSVTAFAEDTSISDQSQEQSATCEVVYDLEPSYCIFIPEMVYAGEEYRFTAQYICLRDTEQIGVYISPLKDDVNIIELSNENGNTLDMTVNRVSDDNVWTAAVDGLVAVFTKSTESNYSMYIDKIFDGKSRPAGMYSGTFEFTIKIEERK